MVNLTLTLSLIGQVWEIPAVSPLWTPMAYAAFDSSKLQESVSFYEKIFELSFCCIQEKDKKKKEKAKKNEPELKPVKEVPIAENEEGSKNETGCVLS